MKKETESVKKSLRTHRRLAQERTLLANERNSLAYVRTGFSSFVLGIALIKLFEDHRVFLYSGWGAIGMGVFLILLGILYYPLRKKKILAY